MSDQSLLRTQERTLFRPHQTTLSSYWRTFVGITQREFLRFVQQRSRFFSALIRPLLWLIVFAAGFRAVLGVSIMPPYGTYITYQVYIAPDLRELETGIEGDEWFVYRVRNGAVRNGVPYMPKMAEHLSQEALWSVRAWLLTKSTD